MSPLEEQLQAVLGVGFTPLLVGFACLSVLLLWVLVWRTAARSARTTEPLVRELVSLGQRVDGLSSGQQQLVGGLSHVSESQAKQQAQLLHLMEARLSTVTEQLNTNLQSSAKTTARSLGELQQRLQTIDKAQENIAKLSSDVLGLQDILANKQARGAFGEIQLNDIVSKALPPDSYTLQVTLSNGKRGDCLIHLPNPPGPLVIDSKFPLDAYDQMRKAKTDAELKAAITRFKADVRGHIKDIAEKYIIEGETADGAVMFLPSEAVYAELHSNFTGLVQEAFQARVWIVSPTTCMATLNTIRAILKDARMREHAGEIRHALGLLHRDVELVSERAGKLETHLHQATNDVQGILTAAERAGKRAHRLEAFDFAQTDADGQSSLPLPLHQDLSSKAV